MTWSWRLILLSERPSTPVRIRDVNIYVLNSGVIQGLGYVTYVTYLALISSWLNAERLHGLAFSDLSGGNTGFLQRKNTRLEPPRITVLCLRMNSPLMFNKESNAKEQHNPWSV